MYNSKVVNVLKKLTSAEQHDLQRFLKSPYFNQRKDVSDLGAWLLKTLKDHPHQLDKRQAWRKVYKTIPYNDQQMRLLMSYLNKLVEQFLVIERFRKNPAAHDLQLLKACRERDLEKNFHQVKKRVASRQKDTGRQDQESLHALFTIFYEEHLYQREQPSGGDPVLHRLNDLLDQQFIYQKLRQTCMFYARNAILNESNQPSFVEYIIPYLQANPQHLQLTGIHLYYQLYQLIRSEPAASPEPFMKWLKPHYAAFSPLEMGSIFRLLINYCIRQMNAGHSDYIQRTFGLYREGIQEGFLLEKRQISAFTYINTMFSGLKLGAFDWVENFLDEYQKFLKAAERDNIYYFCLAHLRYEQGRLGEAMQLLVKFGAKQDFFLYLSAQTTLIKIYLQLKEYDPLESLLQRMQVYIDRKRQIGYRKTPYKKLISVCRKLIHLTPNDQVRKKQLRREAEQIVIPSIRNWLLAQIDAG